MMDFQTAIYASLIALAIIVIHTEGRMPWFPFMKTWSKEYSENFTKSEKKAHRKMVYKQVFIMWLFVIIFLLMLVFFSD